MRQRPSVRSILAVLIGALFGLGVIAPLPVLAQDGETGETDETITTEVAAREVDTPATDAPEVEAPPEAPPVEETEVDAPEVVTRVVDATRPVISQRDNLVAAAADARGAVIEYGVPSAYDDVDGQIPASCDADQGVWFPLGETVVTCYAEDSSGNDARPVAFVVAVIDDQAPDIRDRDNIVVSAVDARGRRVEFDTPSAHDNIDGGVPVYCDAESGARFPLGKTIVTCYAEDSWGNDAAPSDFAISVVDTEAPVLRARKSITVSAEDASGRVVEFGLPRAIDNVDGDVSVGCDVASGARFPLGKTVVTCYAEDAAGNGAEPVSFTVTVVDTDGPRIYARDDITVRAEDASGRVVKFRLPSTKDNVDGEVAVGCDAESEARFPLGRTKVTCYAEDRAGNRAEPSTFVIAVVDEDAPEIDPRGDITVQASDAAGQLVTFGLPAVYDNVDSDVQVVCDPAPGTRFPVGKSTVTCVAKDRAGNEASPLSFVVEVSPPSVNGGRVDAPVLGNAGEPNGPGITDMPDRVDTGVRPGTSEASGTTPPEATEQPRTETTGTANANPTTARVDVPAASAEQDNQPDQTDETEVGVERGPARPTPDPMALPWPPPDQFFPLDSGGPIGGLAGIWRNQNFGLSQEFGHTAFSIAHHSWYAYGARYGLDGYEHTGLDVSMPAGTWLYSPVDGTVIIAGGTPYFTFYGNGQVGVGELLIRTDDGHEVILGHMARITVRAGDRVKAGQFVGLSGGENGDHLHLETRERQRGGFLAIVDPRESFLIPALANHRQGRISETGELLGDLIGRPLGQVVGVTVERAADASLAETDTVPVTAPLERPTPTTTASPGARPASETTAMPVERPIRETTSSPVVRPARTATASPVVPTSNPPRTDPIRRAVVTAEPLAVQDDAVVMETLEPAVSSTELEPLVPLSEIEVVDEPVAIDGGVVSMLPAGDFLNLLTSGLGRWVPWLVWGLIVAP